MEKQEIAIITFKNRVEKCNNKEYKTKDIYRSHAHFLTLKND
jgi:hypothetical protein